MTGRRSRSPSSSGGVLFLSLKQGQGEGWDERPYGPDAPAGFEVVRGWSAPSLTATWIERLALRTG